MTAVSKIDIIINSDASSGEILEMQNLAQSCDLGDVANSGERRHVGADFPPALILVISVMVGNVLSGFLNAIGSDLWAKLKQFIKGATKYYEKQNGGQEIYNAKITLDFRTGEKSILQIIFIRSSGKNIEDLIEKLEIKLQKLNPSKNLIRLEYKNGEWLQDF